MVDLSEKNEPADLITLTNNLKTNDFYARIVKDKAILRKLIDVATQIITQSYGDSRDIDAFLDEAEKGIFTITQNKVKPSFFHIRDVVKESFKVLERRFEKKELITGIPSGFKDLDHMTAGFQKSDLIIVAGRPSMGKTSYCLDVARYAALETEIPVAIFSLEMSKEQLALRLLCSEAMVEAQKLRSGFLRESDWPKLTLAAGNLADAPIFIDDSPAMSVLELRAKARRLQAERNLGLVIIDYLQLMRGRGRTERREQEISEISRSLKALAKELSIPVIAISQLSRRTEERPRQRPQLSDLRESGAIEQDADVILFVYREEVYREDPSNEGVAEIIIGKQRNGPTGTIKLTFLKEFTSFKDSYRGGIAEPPMEDTTP
jgi:replicative DNA helicase